MKNLKHSSTSLLVILVMLSAFTLSVPAAEKKAHERVRVPILTLPMGAGVYEWWASYERIFEENHPWLRVASQETPGFVYNLKEMATNKKRWKTCIFGSSMALIEAGNHAIKPFFKERIPAKPWKYLYPIVGGGPTTWFWVTLNPKIRTMMDFEGKRLGVGLRGQVNWGLWPTVALETLGVKANLEYLGPFPSVEALLDGRVDASQINAITPLVKIRGKDLPVLPQAILQKLLASGRKFYYVSYDNNWIERMKKQKGYVLARAWEFKAGTLPKQEKTVVGIQAQPDGWAVHETFPEEIAYEFTKFMVEHGNKLAKYTKIGEYFIIPKGYLSKIGYTEENVHPGAVRAYIEAGVWE